MRTLSPRTGAMIAIGAFMAICVSRLLITHFFTTDLPFWDQWDSEGWLLLRPFQRGELSWAVLVSAHNEHRILFTRLVALALFILNNRQWDNLISLAFNGIIYALLMAAVLSVLLSRLRWRGYLPLFAFFVLIASLPLAAENLASGFQNQSYFLLAFTFSGIWLAVTRQPTLRWLTALALLAIASVFTLASGLFSGPCFAVAAWLRLRHADRSAIAEDVRAGNQQAGSGLGLVVALASIVALVSGVAYWVMPVLAAHAALRAQDIPDFFAALMRTLSWPLFGQWWGALLIWMPFLVAAPRVVLQRRFAEPMSIAFVTLGGWVIAQALAVAHSRGHAMSDVPSRYLDMLVFGLVVNVYFALRLFEEMRSRKYALSMVMAALFAVYFAGLGCRTVASLSELQTRSGLARIEIGHVKQFLATGDLNELQGKPPLHIPYPQAARLTMMLQDATIRAMLPDSVQPSQPAAKGWLSLQVARLLDCSIYIAAAFLTLLVFVGGIIWCRAASFIDIGGQAP
jgi:hypothetical protein